MALILTLSEAAAADRAQVGSKAKELGRLLDEGVRVPDGIVITAAAAAATPDGEVPDEVRSALEKVLASTEGRLAVRSSAIAEDLGHASYAGQYETVLGVETIDDALAALRRCWESASSDAVTLYRTDHGDEETGIAVIVQRLVEASAAGVAFTANPLTGADEVIIEAVPGVGEALVSGDVTPERWVVRDHEAVLDSPGELGSALTSSQAAEIARECLAIAARRPTAQDVEWAFEDGTLSILQTRPITALPVEPVDRPPPGQRWERDDSYYPDPVTPLTFSAWLPYHSEAWGRVTKHLGLPFERVDHGHWKGRVYDRAVPIGEPRKDRPLPPLPILKLALRIAPPFRRRLSLAARAAAEDRPIRVIDAWESEGRTALRTRTRELRDVDRSRLSDAELADHLAATRVQTLEAATSHFMTAMAGTFILTGQLGLVVEELLGWPAERVLDLVQGYGEASVADGVELGALVEAVRADPDAVSLLERDPLRLVDHDGPGGAELRSFLDRYGHRLLSPRMDSKTWAEDPLPLLRLVKTGFDRPPSTSDPKAVAHAAETEARDAISDPRKRARFEQALERARRGRPYGDETEPDTGEILAVVRYVALEIGARLVARGELTDVDQVMYLSLDELASALRGSGVPVDLARRQAEYRWALANEAPAVFGPEVGDLPPTEAFPARTRDIVGAALWALRMFLTRPGPSDGDELRGLAASPGKATGPVRVIASPEEFDRVQPGDIMVCRHTMAAWSPIFPVLAGLVTERGGPLSHPAILAREYALPAVLSVPDATVKLADGQLITIDGAAGTIEV